MATFYSNTSVAYRLRLELTENSQSVTNNTTTLGYKLYMENTNSAYSYQSISPPDDFEFKIGSTTIYSGSVAINPALGSGSSRLIKDGTTTITHDSDGTKKISFTFKRTGGYISSYSPGTLSGSGSLTLTSIARGSTPTFSGGNTLTLGVAKTITWSRANSNFKHDVWYKLDGQSSWTKFASDQDTSCTLTLPTSLASSYPNSSIIGGELSLETKNGTSGTAFSDKRATFTVSIPNTSIPTISSITPSEQNSAVSSQFGCYVQNKSSIRITVSASGTSGSTIKSYKIQLGSQNYTGTTNYAEFTPTRSGSNTVTVTVTDSRGMSATGTTTVTVQAWGNPQISQFSLARCDSDGTLNSSGAYVKVTYNYSIYPVNNRNTKRFVVQYKNGSSWVDKFTLTESYSASGSKTLSGVTLGANGGNNFRAVATDFYLSTTVTGEVGSTFELVNFKDNGIAFGKMSSGSGFECGLTATFNGAVTMDSTLNVKGAGTFNDSVAFKKTVNINGTGGLYVGKSTSDRQTLYYAKLNNVQLETALDCNSKNLNSVNSITATTGSITTGSITTGNITTANITTANITNAEITKTKSGSTTVNTLTITPTTQGKNVYFLYRFQEDSNSTKKWMYDADYVACRVVNGLICTGANK